MESRLQDILFSELITSVCYWSAVLLLAIAGAALIYWRLTHPGCLADAGQRSIWRSNASISDHVPATDWGGGISRPRYVVRSPRPTGLENVGDGRRSHRSHGRDHSARNARSALKRAHRQFQQS